MEENKILNFFEFVRIEFGVDYIPTMLDSFDYSNVAIKFAKMHVKEAQEAAKNHCEWQTNLLGKKINFTGVEESYPLDNIK